MNKNNLNCYFRVNDPEVYDKVKDVLHEFGIFVSNEKFKSDHRNLSIVEDIYHDLKRADLAIFVLRNSDSLKDIYFEIGVAAGLRKQIFILADFDKTNPAKNTDGLNYVYLNLEDLNTLRFAVGEIAYDAKSTKSLRKEKKQTSSKQNVRIGNFIKKIEKSLEVDPRSRGGAFEDAVAYLFEANGASKLVRGSLDEGVDLVAWVKDAESSIGNPFLVEVKTTLNHRIEKNLTKQLEMLKDSTAGKVLWVIYGTSNEAYVNELQKSYPSVCFCNVYELVNLLENNTLSDALLSIWKRKMNKGVLDV